MKEIQAGWIKLLDLNEEFRLLPAPSLTLRQQTASMFATTTSCLNQIFGVIRFLHNIGPIYVLDLYSFFWLPSLSSNIFTSGQISSLGNQMGGQLSI